MNLFNMLLCSSASENAHAVAVFANNWLIVFVQKNFRKSVMFNVYLGLRKAVLTPPQAISSPTAITVNISLFIPILVNCSHRAGIHIYSYIQCRHCLDSD